ncbi:MAG TPA: flagellar hook protein FlgE [Polyangia bacterium]|jgi:flagellar hook protein FlgE|nr:flagellar hook protein FlgE [Polyangia bacterium]
MSLISSLYTGASGLDANTTDLSVIGDNIANSNTTGFKASRADFSDAMAQQLIGGDSGISQIGLGVQVGSIQQIITQGSLSNTGIATDLAIQGNGYFAVKGTHDGQSGTYLTRDGQFTVDATGNLVNADGLTVQGYMADATGKLATSPSDLKVGASMAPPSASANITMQANLNAEDPAIAAAFDPANPTTTSNTSNSVTVYDASGAAHQVDVFYTKTAANTWTWNAMTAGVAAPVGTGTLTFDPAGTGALVSQTGTISATFPNMTAAQTINVNFGDGTGGVPAGTGLLGVTQFSSPDSTSKISQDGFAAGSLANVSIDSSGKINGAFTNGQTRVIGQVATAVVASADKMSRVGGNLFMTNNQSGDATIGAPSTGGRGGITAGALEQSNVDLANEFVHMISTQRAYQANGKTVTTADALLVELMNIKR